MIREKNPFLLRIYGYNNNTYLEYFKRLGKGAS